MLLFNKKIHYIILFIICMLSMFSCTNRLSVQTQYVSYEDLASYIVNTPDPLLNNPPIGQKIIISWALPPKYFCMNDLHIELTMRFRTNHEICTQKIPIDKRSGLYVYSLLNDDYLRTNGIETYKVSIIGNGQVIEQWRHQLWVELICLDTKE